MNRWLILCYIGLVILVPVLYRSSVEGIVSRSVPAIYSVTNETWRGKRQVMWLLCPIDSGRKTQPSVLTIKAFEGEISKPFLSAIVIIRSRISGKTERFTLINGQLERTFTTPDELFIEVSAVGYSSVKRNMTIALGPHGNRYEFDAELNRMTISLTIWAVDRQTDKVIPHAYFTLKSKTTGMASVTLTPDATTGLSKIELPSKGTYLVSSRAEGYTNFEKSIKLDSLQNEARFILSARQPPAETKPPAKTVDESSISVAKPAVKTLNDTPVAISAVSVSTVAAKPFGPIEKGKPIRLNSIYFDQSSPVLRPESHAELDQLYAVLTENPLIQLEIRGHTDNQGDFDLNIKLSRERCQAVIDYLAGKGISRSRLRAIGRGPIDSVAPNNNEENRSKNRRVEFVVL